MTKIPIPSIIVAALLGCAPAAPLITIYTEPSGLSARDARDAGPKIVVAVWEDGEVVWSQDAVSGGPPYRIGRCAPEKVKAFIEDLERKAVFGDEALGRPNFGPDSSFTTIQIDAGHRRLKMQSWHELYERGGKVVAASYGLTPLEGKTIESFLKTEPESYQKYRRIWSAIRTAITSFIPDSGNLLDPTKEIRLR